MKTMKRTLYTLLAVFALTASQTGFAQDKNDPSKNLLKFNQFYRFLNGAYVDTVKNGALVERAIREVLQQLDPHSTYITAEEMVGVKESFDGSFSGIGIEFRSRISASIGPIFATASENSLTVVFPKRLTRIYPVFGSTL
mgnify:CR=1 FL=1